MSGANSVLGFDFVSSVALCYNAFLVISVRGRKHCITFDSLVMI